MPRTYETVTLNDAKEMLSAAELKAASLGIAYDIAVVDAAGHLVAFSRQDGSPIGCIDLAIGKAVTAQLFNLPTSDLNSRAQPGEALYGIQQTNAGRVVILGGGLPILLGGRSIGAVGASAGTEEQDITVAEAAIQALNLLT